MAMEVGEFSGWAQRRDEQRRGLAGTLPQRTRRAMAVEVVPGNLTRADLEMFARFGIPPDLLGRAAMCRVTDAQARQQYGITARGDMSGIIVPYVDPITGHRVTARLRRGHPEFDFEGKPENKYITPWGDNRHLYFPPGAGALMSDITVPVLIVEAEKSALALTALSARTGRRLLAVATGGCWGWRGKMGLEPGPNGEREQAKGPLPDLERVVWSGRRTIIIFDSNVASNPKVAAAREALAKELHYRGAKVHFVNLPPERGSSHERSR